MSLLDTMSVQYEISKPGQDTNLKAGRSTLDLGKKYAAKIELQQQMIFSHRCGPRMGFPKNMHPVLREGVTKIHAIHMHY